MVVPTSKTNSLNPDLEKKPRHPLHPSYRPLEGVPYKMKNGEDLDLISNYAGMRYWDLIKFNYQTTDLMEVNWYLRHRAGCRRVNWSGNTYEFKWSDDPGIIYLPTWAYKRLIADGHVPSYFFMEDRLFYVRGRVRVFIQHIKTTTCWAVAGAMMTSWKYPMYKTLHESLDAIGEKWRKKYDDNVALLDDDMHQFARDANLSRGGLLDTPEMWTWFLETFGSLMVIQPSAEGYVHWILVTGYRQTAPLTFELFTIDPANGAKRFQDWSTIAEGAKRAKGSLPAMYYFK